jgi:peroxiredoxin
MLEDNIKDNDTQKDEHSAEQPEEVAKKTPRRRRKPPVKKQAMAGPWPKVAVAAIILCLLFAGLSISMFAGSSTDVTVPLIQDISISDVVESGATITWKTSEPATGQVTACNSDNCTSTKTNELLLLSHTVALTNIQPNTRYQLTISSKNKQGKEAKIKLDLNLNAKTTVVIGSRIGDLAPDFTLPTVDGIELTLSQFRGKLVMVNFFETTCPPCEEETAYIQEIYDAWPHDKLEILAVSVGQRQQFVKSFLDSRGLTFPTLLDTDQTVQDTYQVSQFPTTFFINSDGIIKVIKSGRFNSSSEIDTILKAL